MIRLCINFLTRAGTPNFTRSRIRIAGITLSKALRISINAPTTTFPAAKLARTKLVRPTILSTHDRPQRKPNCESGNIQFDSTSHINLLHIIFSIIFRRQDRREMGRSSFPPDFGIRTMFLSLSQNFAKLSTWPDSYYRDSRGDTFAAPPGSVPPETENWNRSRDESGE